jgi:hypothetical protein
MTYAPPTADQDADELLQQMVDAMPILDHTDADVRDAARARLMQDIAYGVYPAEEVAVRYALGSVAGLKVWLQKNPETMRQIKVMKAMHQSDMALNDRLRMKGGHAVEQATIGMAGIAMDPTKDAKIRIEAFKALQRQAGVDGPPPPDKTAAVGVQTNIIIHHGSGPPVTISSTTVVPETIEALPATVEVEAGEFEEDA